MIAVRTILESACRTRIALPLLVALSPTAAAQKKSEAQIQAEINFARGLAAEWTFVELAQSVLEDTNRSGIEGEQREELGLVTCEVFAVGARNERDDVRRNQLFMEALDAYRTFIEENPYSKFKGDAEANLVDTAAQFSISVDIALESAAGEEADALREQKIEVLEDTVKVTQDLIESLQGISKEERSQAQARQLKGLMLNRGTMLADIGRSSDEGAYYFARSIESLENMIFEFIDDLPTTLTAYKAMGDVYRYSAQLTDARYMYEGVIQEAWPLSEDDRRMLEENAGQKFTEDNIAARYIFLELATMGLLEVLIESGEIELASEYALHFYNTRQEYGLNWSVPTGYESLLACARTLVEAGGYIGGDQAAGEAMWFATEEEMKDAVSSRRNQEDAVSFALKLADTVNRDNKANILQVRAQNLLGEIASRPGVQVSPSVLVEAAEGDYYAGEYVDAVSGFQRVLRRLEALDPAERREYGARVMRFLGDSYRQSGRELEAGLAYREGIVRWQGDPEYDSVNAERYLGIMRRLTAATPGDASFQAMRVEAEDLYTQYSGGGSADLIQFNRGMKAYGAKNFDDAVAQFSQVTKESDLYEKAMVKTAVSRFRKAALGKDNQGIANAISSFDQYIETYVTDPANNVESEARKARRTEALAEAEFYRGLGTNIVGGDEKNQKIVDWLSDYAQRYPTQDVLSPWTLEMVVRAHIELGELPEARTKVDEMVADWEENKRTASAIKVYYNGLKALRSAESTAQERKLEITAEMAGFLKVANQLGSPDYGSLRNESLHWMDLGNYEEALRVTERLLDTFGSEPERTENIQTYVLPDYGQILLEVGRVAEAKDILTSLVLGDAGGTPSKVTVLNWTRSVTGWLVGGQAGKPVREIVGAGGSDEEWQQVITKLDTITQVGDKWQSCEWYEQKLMIIYTYYAWGQQDQRKLESAKNQLSQIDINLEDPTYAEVDKFCQPGETDDPEEIIRRLGNGVLQARYQYMSLKLPR